VLWGNKKGKKSKGVNDLIERAYMDLRLMAYNAQQPDQEFKH
jgi:hypothetical protein